MTAPSWEDRAERHLAAHYGETIYDPQPEEEEEPEEEENTHDL